MAGQDRSRIWGACRSTIRGPILHARVEIIGTAHHHLGAFEVHLVVNVPGDIITIKQQGEVVVPLLVEAFDALDRRLSEHCQISQQKVKAHEEFTRHGRIAPPLPGPGVRLHRN